MKKFMITALLAFMALSAAYATEQANMTESADTASAAAVSVSNGSVPAKVRKLSTQSNRRTGYRGCISVSGMYNVWLGAETSHGYIFNRQHYFGGGIGASVAPVENIYVLGHIFADYRYFIMTQDSTPALGIKAGYCMDLRNDPSGPPITKAAEIEVNIGWDWSFRNGSGVFLQFAFPFFIGDFFQFLPKLAFGVEF